MLTLTYQSKLRIIILIVFAGLTLFLTACNSQAERLNLDGNEAFSEQAYLEALELYRSAQIESPELAEPYYNAANALYRQGDYPAALEQMQMALQYIDEVTLAESSFFNMGNSLFNSQDPGTAVEAYKQALLLDPEDIDAKYNLELALQQQEQQEQEQEQQNQEGEQGENQDQSGEDSESDSEQNEEEQEGSENGENQDESDQSQNNEEQDDQTQEGDQSEQDDHGNGDQEQDQRNAGGQPQESEDQQEGELPSQIPAPGQRMTEEQAKQLLAAIANDMQTLQERLGQLLFSQQLPPAQDW